MENELYLFNSKLSNLFTAFSPHLCLQGATCHS